MFEVDKDFRNPELSGNVEEEKPVLPLFDLVFGLTFLSESEDRLISCIGIALECPTAASKFPFSTSSLLLSEVVEEVASLSVVVVVVCLKPQRSEIKEPI
jgi:hypothetical protein